MTNIIIRRLKSSDYDLAIIAKQLNEADWDASIKDFSEKSLREFLVNNGRHYVIAYCDGELAGAVHGYNLLHPTGDIYLYVDEVDTIVEYRRQGVATALMNEFFKIGSEVGALELWLGTEHDNEEAKALYEKLKPSEIDNGPIYTYKIPRQIDGN